MFTDGRRGSPFTGDAENRSAASAWTDQRLPGVSHYAAIVPLLSAAIGNLISRDTPFTDSVCTAERPAATASALLMPVLSLRYIALALRKIPNGLIQVAPAENA